MRAIVTDKSGEFAGQKTQHLAQQPFTTTLDYGECDEWKSRAVPIPMPETLLDELRAFLRILAALRTGRPMVLDSSAGRLHPDMLAAALIGFLPRRLRPLIVLTGCMWDRDAGFAGKLQGLIMRLADRAITRYVVQSTEEMTIFPQTWGVDPDKLRLCTYFYTIPPADAPNAHAAAPVDDLPADYVFSGGNAHRDYDTLVEVARRLPERQFVIATRRLDGRDDLPPNLTARQVPHAQFVTLMHNARAVVVPMQGELTRATGQQTYLNAMVAGKPTIVSRALGVNDHIAHRQNGWIVEGSVEQYVEALQWVYDPANAPEVAAMSSAARLVVLDCFTFNRFERCILNALNEALSERA